MSKSLLIVESPAKARTLKGYLGKGFQVEASVGHVKDLPKSSLGVDVENGFEPQYGVIRGKGQVIKNLKAAAKKVDAVYLAPDPDREGEAIACHIADEIRGKKGGGPPIYRVMISEITKKGLLAALDNPTELDYDRYNAQQARRILDRLVGYQISPLLWQKVRRGLSAGRVQSVAVRLVVDRERQIESFLPEEYWTLDARLKGAVSPEFTARLRKVDSKTARPSSREEALALDRLARTGSYTLAKVERKQQKRNPSPPFITSTLQREAFRKLRFSAKKTMTLAQRLYEGVDVGGTPVGLITYMRTDSTRLSEDAVADCRDYIDRTYGSEYLPGKPLVYKTKKSAQDAHEAIRPTGMEYSPDQVRGFLDPDQYKLYKLIWDRFISCQMPPAIFDRTVFDVVNGKLTFQGSGSILKFKGFMAVYVEGTDEPEAENGEDGRILPDLKEGDSLELVDLSTDQRFTQPPARFTESTLVKELEDKGIGRPSTYAQILSTIRDKGYVEMKDRKFVPTELGVLVNDLLVTNFPTILDAGFTARMEAELDEVEEGSRDWKGLLLEFYEPFAKTLEKASTEMESVKSREEPTDVECDQCGKNMVIKWGRNGFFLACPGYPECKNTKEFKRREDGTIEVVTGESLGQDCPECEKELIIKRGRRGRFVACTGYPDCRYTRPVSTGVACQGKEGGGCSGSTPGELVEKQSKTGRIFYACNRYPECQTALWDKPIARECPECNNPYLVEKFTKNDTYVRCPRKGCGYKESGEG